MDTRLKGISLFKPTSGKGDFYEKWRKETFDVILKYRVADSDFKAFEKKKNIYIYERHYSKDSTGLTNTGKKTVKLCALPTANLPPKSHDIAKIGRKPPIERVPTTLMDIHVNCYNHFDEICMADGKLKSEDWTLLPKRK